MTPLALPPRSLLMDDARPGGRSWLYRDPIAWIEARTPDAAFSGLARIDAAIEDGLWVAGAFGFELGYILEPRLHRLYRPSRDPLIAVGLYRDRQPAADGAAAFDALAQGKTCTIGAGEPALSPEAYDEVFARIRDYIVAGDIYQLNLTWPLALPVEGDPFARLPAWRRRARAGHAAILRLDDRDILSFSPELFLAADGDGMIRTRPMKGTSARGADTAEDAIVAAQLSADPKQRAENLMIVDLLRNDLSRICEAGSVRVGDLFTVETYPTLHSMTSGIEGRLRADVSPADILKAVFPCGSVTGAPKVRAMEIIAETEPETRGVYCGAIGAIGPGGRWALNVAIRTLVHEHGDAALRMGVGGGLVYDSDGPSEYAECLLKARFATGTTERFDILETLRWSPAEGFVFLDAHLARMADAARYFLRPFDRAVARGVLDAHVAGADGTLRVRLLLDETGNLRAESMPLDDVITMDPAASDTPLRLIVTGRRLASHDPFMRHKTTSRTVYDAALAEARAAGADEAILLNEHGRIADGSFMSIFIRRDGVLLTPPSSEGALPGVLKRVLQERGAPPVVEQVLTPADLQRATLFAGNSVRGLRRASLANG